MIVPPALFGHELAGDVVAMGSDVKIRDRATCDGGEFGALRHRCYYCCRGRVNLCEDLLFNNGAYAEYIRIPARIVREEYVCDSDRIWSYRDAALAEPLACVLKGVEDVPMKPWRHRGRDRPGPIGIMFVRIAKVAGARVIAVGRRRAQTDRVCAAGSGRGGDTEDTPNAVTRFGR